MGSVGILPFPCMITHFCWAAGVKVFETNRSDIVPVCNIGRTDYNNFAHNAGLDEIPSTNPTAIKRRHLGVEEDMSETQHVDPIAIPEPSQPFRDVPPWAQMICSQLDDISSQINDIRSQFDARFGTIETRLLAVETACQEFL
ncbi:hypothetical protein L2E82_49758 [Cichorium intybus]|uniref:Uncharacterized protein n=1 Tax=Cichorium intybus TaxID=13427 RepID=A0ACB8Z169_CICIN|nr:hypothetical protein L2E82_49758 [Cichorium intybus]